MYGLNVVCDFKETNLKNYLNLASSLTILNYSTFVQHETSSRDVRRKGFGGCARFITKHRNMFSVTVCLSM